MNIGTGGYLGKGSSVRVALCVVCSVRLALLKWGSDGKVADFECVWRGNGCELN
jgi:hypothetical protein